MPTTDPRIDTYIEQAAPFARPILTAVRAAFHAGCPDVVETIKWGHPSFEHHGILGGMAAFKAHATFGFWRGREIPDPAGILGDDPKASAMHAKFADVSELPPRKVLAGYVREAARLNESGTQAARPGRKPKERASAPGDLLAAIAANAAAQAFWDGLTPGYRNEYVEWVTEAKREATRATRVEQTVAWLAEGKTRNWKYRNC